MEVRVEIRNVYGVQKVYPLSPAAQRFAAIAGTKTLSADVLANIIALGFKIVEVPAYSLAEVAA